MDMLYKLLPPWLRNWLRKPDSDEERKVESGATDQKEEEEVAVKATKEDNEFVLCPTEEDEHAARASEEDEFVSFAAEQDENAAPAPEQEDAATEPATSPEVRVTQENTSNTKDKVKRFKAQIISWLLYHKKEFRNPQAVKRLGEDLELAEEIIKEYVTYFNFRKMSLDSSLRLFLKVFWPEDDPGVQHLLLTYFAQQYRMCTRQRLLVQPALYHLTCVMIILNSELHGHQKGRKWTCDQFIETVKHMDRSFSYTEDHISMIYDSIKIQPLKAFIVRSTDNRRPVTGSDSTSETDKNSTTTVHKTGRLIRKRVLDKNGKKPRKWQRSWETFNAELKGTVLYLQKDPPDLFVSDEPNTIRLHHAVANPVDYKKRPHVFSLRTADSRVFYFQAESEVEQKSWVAIINFIAARYSAPPLTAYSHDEKTQCPQILPSYPSRLSLQQQLQFLKNELKRIAKQLDDKCDFQHISKFQDDHLNHNVQEMSRYEMYGSMIEQYIDPGEGCSNWL